MNHLKIFQSIIRGTIGVGSALLILGSLSFASDIHVALGESIQSAINSANNGDRVLVDQGTYDERIDFMGKAIDVIATGGPVVTTLDGGAAGTVVSFLNGEGPNSRLQGFTITNGVIASGISGGGIVASFGSTPLIEDCVIRNNAGRGGGAVNGSPIMRRCSIYNNSSTSFFGGAIYGAPQMSDCVIAANVASSDGGGLYLVGGSGTALIEDCVIVENVAALTNHNGGGVYVDSSVNATFARCIIANNVATGGVFAGLGGGVYVESSGTTFDSCVILNNIATGSSIQGGGVLGPVTITNSVIRGNTEPQLVNVTSIDYSDVEGGFPGNSNFDLLPGFVDEAGRDFHPMAGSVLIDAGDPALSDPDGTRKDVGAYPHETLYMRDNAASLAWVDPSWPEVSVGIGGQQVVTVQAGAAHANEAYAVLGSITGDSPGFVVLGTLIPLNPDDYTLTTLLDPSSTPLIGASGTLAGDGSGSFRIVLPPSDPSLSGLTAWHAVIFGTLQAPFVLNATNAVSVNLVD